MIKHIVFPFVWYWLSSTYNLDNSVTTVIAAYVYYIINRYESPKMESNKRPLIESVGLFMDTYLLTTVFFQVIMFVRVAESIDANYNTLEMVYITRHSILEGIKEYIVPKPKAKPGKKRRVVHG